ncbi:ECF transporter S component [Jeotgalibaca sp. A122]|uniref:ECF transporter S component n=1 Tax=Jeotgalibaca sp. A122 TaxID=3457322 RepID=UPI003FCF749C
MSMKRYDAKHIALLAILVALNYVGRVVFQFLPNVQPMTAILLILTLYLGLGDGLIVAGLSLFLSNMIMGMGPWTFAQLFSYAVIILFTGIVLRPIHGNKTKWLFVLFALFSGFFYGFVISLVSYKTYGMTNFWAYYTLGLPFDFAHAVGNAGFYIILEPILRPLFEKYIKK